MDEKARSRTSGYEDFLDSLEWRWWHNVLGLVTVLAIVILTSW
jgi:hypothetical protein